jgi:hypothetical protein
LFKKEQYWATNKKEIKTEEPILNYRMPPKGFSLGITLTNHKV